MFGYLNVFLAAALMANGLSDADAVRVLNERDPDAFELRGDALGWRGHTLTAEAIRHVRESVAVSFGSCSFREPVDELRALTLAPT
jgi:type II secretory pathway component PulK